VPFSGLAARSLRGVDLRTHGSGTVSGTGLYEVAGFMPLAVAGSLDVVKGAVGVALAGPERSVLRAAAAGSAIAAHNWSPWLRGAGGRGISPALGALLVCAPEGAALLLGGLVAGRLCRQSALGTMMALVALPGLLWKRRGRDGLRLAVCVVVPMVAKRLLGNDGRLQANDFGDRLLYDRDSRHGTVCSEPTSEHTSDIHLHFMGRKAAGHEEGAPDHEVVQRPLRRRPRTLSKKTSASSALTRRPPS
jgi:glycerol-3-phosphate acyltransferase PlsY